jgi:hypothetical protein
MMNITWSWDEPEENTKPDEIDYPECLAEDIMQAEQEMQALDAKFDPDGLDKQGQAAWDEYESEEEFGVPNASYCQSMEPDHNGGWFCHHPECVTSHDEGLCEGCHRPEEICTCGGVPGEF